VWEAETGKEIARMTHGDGVNSVAFSPDGKYVVSGSLDKTARVWEATTGKEVARMAHDDKVWSVAFNLDGNYVGSGSADNTARVWEAATGQEIARMTHDDEVHSVAFCPATEATTGSSLSTVLPETSACETPTLSVKINNAYMREGPDIRFQSLAQYKKGDQVTVLGRYRDWFQAETPDGKKGWLYKDWLTIPSNIDTSAICSIPVEDLPSTPQNNQKTPQNGEECVPSYYVSCP
jgi:hypothetical protein